MTRKTINKQSEQPNLYPHKAFQPPLLCFFVKIYIAFFSQKRRKSPLKCNGLMVCTQARLSTCGFTIFRWFVSLIVFLLQNHLTIDNIICHHFEGRLKHSVNTLSVHLRAIFDAFVEVFSNFFQQPRRRFLLSTVRNELLTAKEFVTVLSETIRLLFGWRSDSFRNSF